MAADMKMRMKLLAIDEGLRRSNSGCEHRQWVMYATSHDLEVSSQLPACKDTTAALTAFSH